MGQPAVREMLYRGADAPPVAEAARELDAALEGELVAEVEVVALVEQPGAEAQAQDPSTVDAELAVQVDIREIRAIPGNRYPETRRERPSPDRRRAILGAKAERLVSSIEHAECPRGEFEHGRRVAIAPWTRDAGGLRRDAGCGQGPGDAQCHGTQATRARGPPPRTTKR
jgi:hypothetical protein